MTHPYAKETVYVKADNERGYKVVDKERVDAEERNFQLYSGKIEDDTKTVKNGKLVPNDQPEGTVGEAGPGGTKNPSGTFSTPTPTDIRFSDKYKTEFENNMGAFIGKSAAQIRDALGLPDAPGGLHPVASLNVKRNGNKNVLIGADGKEWVSMSKQEADKYESMNDDEKLVFVAMKRRDEGKIDAAVLKSLGAPDAVVTGQTGQATGDSKPQTATGSTQSSTNGKK